MNNNLKKIKHSIPPLYFKTSKILILGSFPSVKSREQAFFYGHPQNRFWRVIAGVFEREVPQTVEEKTNLIRQCDLALWDVIESCEIIGSDDSSIRNVKANDIDKILRNSEIKKIFVNGKTAYKYYEKLIKPSINIDVVCLPSTSPANATYNLSKLMEKWSVIKE